MEDEILDSEPRVLIVDRSEENREVLETALSRRGFSVLTAHRLPEGVRLARQCAPDLIVLDVDSTHDDPAGASAELFGHGDGARPPVVMLGTIRRGATPAVDREFVAKPYHYGPLIRRIEELLGTSGARSLRTA